MIHGGESVNSVESKVDRKSKKLKKIMLNAQKKKNIELLMETIETYAFLHVSWNQIYADFEVERYLNYIKSSIADNCSDDKMVDGKTVVFHDGFGVDMWDGLAYIYINALLKLGYRVIKISSVLTTGIQPKLKEAMTNRNIIFEYYCASAKRIVQANDIRNIINKYNPSMAFLYIPPWDTAALIAYACCQGKVKRFLINSTDHTFGMGQCAFDVCIEFRNYGAYLSMQHRKIPKDKLCILPFYPLIDYSMEFQGFPFEADGFKVVFSGGAPYKTYDTNNTFFKIIETMLNRHKDVIFVFAPKSETLNCKHIKEKYPDRFFLIDKRQDLYQVLVHSYLYLGTYPIGGGLMNQYAAAANKYLLVVKRNDEMSGILREDIENKVYYQSIADLAEDLDALLNNPQYLETKEKLIKNAIIDEDEFENELNSLISKSKTKWEIGDKVFQTKDTEDILAESFKCSYIWNKAILRDEVRPELVKYFPLDFIRKEIKTAQDLFVMKCNTLKKNKGRVNKER